MGAEARQAGRLQPLSPGRRRRRLQHGGGRRGRDPPRALRHHPRRRHGAPARRRSAAGGRAGPPAQPLGLRRRAGPGRLRLRHSAAAGGDIAAERAPLALRVDPVGSSGRRSVHHRSVGRVPGSLRRGELHREGDLRRRRLRACHPGPVPREHAAVARPDRGQLRPRGARDRHPGLRRLSDPLPHLHPSETPLDPRRLAAPPVAHDGGARSRRPRAQSAVAALALEDPGQPAPEHGRAGAARVPGGRVDHPARLAAPLDGARVARRGGAVERVAAARRAPAAVRQVMACVLRGGRARRRRERAAGGARHRIPPAPGVDLRGRDRADALAAVREPPTAARVADGVANGASGDPFRRRLAHDVARGRAGGRHRDAGGGRRPRPGPGRAAAALAARPRGPAARGTLVGLARARGPAERAGHPARAPAVAVEPRRRDALRAAPLALLRPLRHRRHPVARARQLPGGPRSSGGDAHVAHQHRAPAPRHRQRPRPRLHHRRGDDPAAGARDALARAHAPVPGPLLQLVRAARPPGARAGVHLDRRQRQLRRAPHRAAPRVPHHSRRAALRPGRVAGPGDGGGAGPRWRGPCLDGR